MSLGGGGGGGGVVVLEPPNDTQSRYQDIKNKHS